MRKLIVGKLQRDDAQLKAVKALDELAEALQRPHVWWRKSVSPQGIYLYGPEGGVSRC